MTVPRHSTVQDTADQIKALEAELIPLASQAAKVKAVFRLIAAKEPVPLELVTAVGVITASGHARFSERAGRLMLTESGRKFARQMRKFG